MLYFQKAGGVRILNMTFNWSTSQLSVGQPDPTWPKRTRPDQTRGVHQKSSPGVCKEFIRVLHTLLCLLWVPFRNSAVTNLGSRDNLTPGQFDTWDKLTTLMLADDLTPRTIWHQDNVTHGQWTIWHWTCLVIDRVYVWFILIKENIQLWYL